MTTRAPARCWRPALFFADEEVRPPERSLPGGRHPQRSAGGDHRASPAGLLAASRPRCSQVLRQAALRRQLKRWPCQPGGCVKPPAPDLCWRAQLLDKCMPGLGARDGDAVWGSEHTILPTRLPLPGRSVAGQRADDVRAGAVGAAGITDVSSALLAATPRGLPPKAVRMRSVGIGVFAWRQPR